MNDVLKFPIQALCLIIRPNRGFSLFSRLILIFLLFIISPAFSTSYLSLQKLPIKICFDIPIITMSFA